MYGTFVQSTYEDKGKEKFRLCSKSPLTSLLGQEKIESKSFTFGEDPYEEDEERAEEHEGNHGVIEARVSRSFDEMITIDLVESTLTIRLQTCTTLRLSNR